MDVQKEANRLLALFESADEKKIALLQGEIIENARLRCRLEELNAIADKTGLVKFNPQHPQIHKMTPVFSSLIKLEASYANSTRMLCRELSGNTEEDEEDMEDYE